MNNLKRVLSMALASVMLVGMMAVGASAMDFTDADKIQYANAVEILVALKVINGKDNGSFDPQGDVTRGEMAKMISVAMNGGNEANTGTKTTPTFTDIGGHWAESYIEYCSDLKIISGRGDGTFAPNDNVTGLEAAKMVLTALGYDANAYQLTGASWAVRTDELAKKCKPSLFDNLAGVQMASPASREVAAQIIWNGLQNRTRTIDPSETLNTGEITWGYGKGDNTMLYERYGAQIWVGTYVGNDKNVTSAKKGEIVVDGIIEGATKADGTPANASRASLPSDMGIENIGEEVKVIFKDGGSGNTIGKPDGKDTIYGVFNTGATQVVKTSRGLIKDNKTGDAQINVDGAKYDVKESGVTVYTNYASTSNISGVKGTDPKTNVEGTNSALTKYLQAFNGNTIKFVFNSDNEIFAAYVEESVLGVVSAVSNGKITISSEYGATATLNVADNDIYDGAAKDDVVTVKTLYSTDHSKAFHVVTKADVVSGTVDSYKDTENVVVDGSTYEIYNHTSSMHTANLTDSVKQFDSSSVGQDFDLYLVNGYVAAAVQTSEGSSNYSVIVDSNAPTSTLGSAISGTQIVVLGADGIRTTLTVSSESVVRTSATTSTPLTDTNKGTALVKGAIVTYTIDRNGDAEVTVEAQPATAASAKQIEYVKATKTVKLNGKTYTVASDAALFGYVDAATAAGETDVAQFKAYTLRQMGDNAVAAGGKYSVVLDKDNVVKAVYINQGAKPTGATDNTVYGIVTAKIGTVKIDNADYVQYTVGVNEDTYTVNISKTLADQMEKNDMVTPLKRGTIVRLDPTADNIYTATEFKAVKKTDADTIVGLSKEYNEADGTVTVYTGSKINGELTEGTNPATYAVADDVNIFYVDQNADVGVLGTIGAFDAMSGSQNIILILDKDEVITDIVFETSNQWDILNAGV